MEVEKLELLPQLALTYFKLGKLECAHQIMGETELSLQIFIGGAKCIETEVGYDALYAQGTFRQTLIAAELIKKYKAVKEQIGFRLR